MATASRSTALTPRQARRQFVQLGKRCESHAQQAAFYAAKGMNQASEGHREVASECADQALDIARQAQRGAA